MIVSFNVNKGVPKCTGPLLKQSLNRVYITKSISFKGESKEIGGNETLNTFNGSNFMGSGNSSAKNVFATKVYLKDTASVENLILTKGYRDRRPYSVFRNEDDPYNLLEYIGYPADIVVENNTIVKNISSQRAYNNIKLICETGIPQIPEKFIDENTSYYVLGKNIKYTKPLKTRYALLKDYAKAFDKNAHSVYLKNSAKANTIETETLIMEDSSFVEKAFVNFVAKVKGNAFCKELTINGVYSEKSCVIGDNAKINQLRALQISRLTITDNAQIDNIVHKKDSFAYTTIKGNSKVNNVNASNVKQEDNSITKSIKAENFVELSGNSSAENIIVSNGSNPFVYIQDKAKVTGKIEFKNTQGTVLLFKDPETGKYPEIDASAVINGKIIKNEDINREYLKYEKNSNFKNDDTTSSSVIEKQAKGFARVAGMDELKRTLYEDVIYPVTHSEEYKEYGLDPVNGFLLYGPPGCGKTYIAKALAEETKRYFVEMPASSVGSIYQHQTTQNIAAKFSEAKRHAPSIIFIDEVEALAPSREDLDGSSSAIDINEQITELLQQINNCREKDILIIFASNEPQRIDNAIIRTGRIDKRIFLPPPDVKTREALFSLNLGKINKKEENIDTDRLAKLTPNYTAEDIRMVVRQASLIALRKHQNVSLNDLESAIKIIKPSLNEALVESYKQKGEST